MSNKNYLCIMRSPAEKCNAPSPANMDEMYARFNAWREKFQDNILDMGGKLNDGKVVTTEDVSDGPFSETKEIIGGYMIITAGSFEEAVEVVRHSPGVFPGSSVEVREISSS